MEIVYEVRETCQCVIKIRDFLSKRQQSGFPELGVNTVIKCDCEKNWMLTEYNGTREWVEVQALPEGLK
jgi:hypothetical protein